MTRKSLINDVSLEDEEDKGYPILFANQEIRKMFRLVKASSKDVFYDLGSGWGQNLIIAATEFNVKKCVGIEKDPQRCKEATDRVKRRSLKDRIFIHEGKFEKLFSGKLDVDLHEATIIFYGLSTDAKILRDISKNISKDCKLVYYFNCLFPEIMPEITDYPFYVSIYPFKKTKSEFNWLTSIIQKKKSSLHKNNKPTTQELWDELKHDYDTFLLGTSYVVSYKRRLKKILKK